MELQKKQNIEHAWTLLCKGSSIDQRNNNLTLFNVIEQLNITVKPGSGKEILVPFDMEMITLWNVNKLEKPSNADVEVDLSDPKGKLLKTMKYKLEIRAKIRRARSVGSIRSLKVTESGDYTFKIKIKPAKQVNFFEIGRVALEINLVEKE